MYKKPCAFILAGGKGTRLEPLTNPRTKPATPWGASYRMIDIPQSNLLNSGIERIIVAGQFKPQSLSRNINQGWTNHVSGRGRFIRLVHPYEDEKGLNVYPGTAGAIERNIDEIPEDTSLVNILAGDHIYLMDFNQKNKYHQEQKSDFTISVLAVSVELAANTYGVLRVDEQGRVLEFQEKPAKPAEIPGKPGMCWASAGIYTADPEILKKFLLIDREKETPFTLDGKPDKKKIAQDPKRFSSHDFGYDIIPLLLKSKRNLFVYDMKDNNIPYRERFSNQVKDMPEEQRGFWMDVGSIDQYFESNMELVKINPRINIYNPLWPLYNASGLIQPSKNVEHQILFGNGVIRKNGYLERCIIGDGSTVEGSKIVNAILLGENYVEKGCRIEDTIIDKGVHVPSGSQIYPGSPLADQFVEKKEWVLKDGKIIVPKGFEF